MDKRSSRKLIDAFPHGNDEPCNANLLRLPLRNDRCCALSSRTGASGKGMSGRRPVVKGLAEALRTLRVRSCLRPVGAGNECPAGPDAGPHGSSPNQQNALVMALPFSSGLRAVPLVHIASPSPSMRIALRRNLVPAELAGSGRDRTVVVIAAFGRERIDDPRQLVGERHRGQLELVLDGLALEQSARPAAQGVVMPLRAASAEQAPTTRSLRK